MEHIRQICLHLIQLDFAAFDAAHIQNIINQAQEMIAGRQNLGQVILYLVLLLKIGQSQSSKADNRIHRGANVVGHIGQEHTLGLVGRLRYMQGILRRNPQPVQLMICLLLHLHQLAAALHLHHADNCQHQQKQQENRERHLCLEG